MCAPGLRLLVVDDNVDSAQGLALWLENAGHTVRLAHAGDVALEQADEFHPDAVLLDIGLPVLNGFEVAERLRRRSEFKTVPLIAMTGFGGQADRRRAALAGFDHYLVKPINHETLTNVLSLLARPAVTIN